MPSLSIHSATQSFPTQRPTCSTLTVSKILSFYWIAAADELPQDEAAEADEVLPLPWPGHNNKFRTAIADSNSPATPPSLQSQMVSC